MCLARATKTHHIRWPSKYCDTVLQEDGQQRARQLVRPSTASLGRSNRIRPGFASARAAHARTMADRSSAEVDAARRFSERPPPMRATAAARCRFASWGPNSPSQDPRARRRRKQLRQGHEAVAHTSYYRFTRLLALGHVAHRLARAGAPPSHCWSNRSARRPSPAQGTANKPLAVDRCSSSMGAIARRRCMCRRGRSCAARLRSFASYAIAIFASLVAVYDLQYARMAG